MNSQEFRGEVTSAIERSTAEDASQTGDVAGSASVASMAALPSEGQSSPPVQIVKPVNVMTVSVEEPEYQPLSWNNTGAEVVSN